MPPYDADAAADTPIFRTPPAMPPLTPLLMSRHAMRVIDVTPLRFAADSYDTAITLLMLRETYAACCLLLFCNIIHYCHMMMPLSPLRDDTRRRAEFTIFAIVFGDADYIAATMMPPLRRHAAAFAATLTP